MYYCQCHFLSLDCVSAIADVITAVVAVIALFYSHKEYKNHLKRSKSEILSKFNERYSNDKNIKKVVAYILSVIEQDRCNKEKESKLLKEPGTFEKEMFMRFFEELNLATKSDSLDRQQVRELFGYYALLAAATPNFLYPDTEKDNWGVFADFVRMMESIKPLSEEDKRLFQIVL